MHLYLKGIVLLLASCERWDYGKEMCHPRQEALVKTSSQNIF